MPLPVIIYYIDTDGDFFQPRWLSGKSVRLWNCQLGFDSESGQTNPLKFTAYLLDASITGTVWRTCRQVYWSCRWERHLTGLLHLGVVDRWPVTPKRVR